MLYKETDITEINQIDDIIIPFSQSYPAAEFLYIEYFFSKAISGIKNKRVFSIGGGIDKIALNLASRGNKVTTIDISQEAIAKTVALAKKLNISSNIEAYPMNFETEDISGEFDIVITHDVLHHLETFRAVNKIHSLLKPQGCLFSMEPICLLGLIRSIHSRFPVYPFPYLPEIEKELSCVDLNIVREKFRKVTFDYFGFLIRELTAGYLYKAGLHKWLGRLGRVDYLLMKSLPILRNLGSYVIFCAEK